MINKTGKAIGIGVLLFLLSFQSNAQMLEKGDIIADVYVGGPNLTKALIKLAYKLSDIDLDVSSTPMVGARVMYMYDDMISFGVDVNYRSTEVNFVDIDLTSLNQYDYQIVIPEIRASLRAEYHLNKVENMDIYFPAAIGYKSSTVKLKTDDPNYQFPSKFPSFSPFSWRVGVGVRYFIIQNISLNTEVGFGGGALFQAGVSIKI